MTGATILKLGLDNQLSCRGYPVLQGGNGHMMTPNVLFTRGTQGYS